MTPRPSAAGGGHWEPLLSGYVRRRVAVPALGTLSVESFGLPLSAPFNATGHLRYAPTPTLSLWAGLRPAAAYNPLTATHTLQLLVEVELTPYINDGWAGAPPARLEVLRVPIGDPIAAPGRRLGVAATIPWPAGGAGLRISYLQTVANNLGPTVDFCASWSASAWPSFPVHAVDRGRLG